MEILSILSFATFDEITNAGNDDQWLAPQKRRQADSRCLLMEMY